MAKEDKAVKSEWELKKLLYGASILIAFLGTFGLLIFTFMVNDALDKTQGAITSNIDAVENDLRGLQSVAGGAETELDSVNATLGDLGGSIIPLADGLDSTASSINSISQAASSIPMLGSGMTGQLASAATSMSDSASKLRLAITGFSSNQKGISDMKDAIGAIKSSISDQLTGLDSTKTSIEDIFGLIKIANILFFIAVVCMFGTLIMNSIAGLM